MIHTNIKKNSKPPTLKPISRKEWFKNFIDRAPFICEWVKYKGGIFYGVINLGKTYEAGRMIVNLYLNRSDGLLGKGIIRCIQYRKNRFKILWNYGK